MFGRVLIANRGEVALRIIRACRESGLETVIAHSEADCDAMYTRLADQAVCIGRAPAAGSYLNQDAIILAAIATGAGAIHPGYGFLSENADFAGAVEAAGLVFIGPSHETLRSMGDKIEAKRMMREMGVPCVPGSDGARDVEGDGRLVAAAARIGYPVIVKAAGGGGGRGMRIARSSAELDDALAITRKEARRAFGNPEIYVEAFLEKPRHIEVQVLGDGRGEAVSLGARDCSVQRRHQKVIEEAPTEGLDAGEIDALGECCAAACRRMRYRGAGTFEFLHDRGAFFFIEMNTRLQVEHPVTEMVTGLDIVRAQLAIARGQGLGVQTGGITPRGHAVECRILAEDPSTLVPSAGRITAVHLPGGAGIRVDTHIHPGCAVPPHYDNLLAKLIAHAPSRPEALRRMGSALHETHIDGVGTNLGLLRAVIADPEYDSGRLDVGYLERWLSRRGRSQNPDPTSQESRA